uniref:Uncharacterized protein n=1 Tax=viral metagenome TaxID=1070528 RepID=A0A6C0C814_9ZZZZ
MQNYLLSRSNEEYPVQTQDDHRNMKKIVSNLIGGKSRPQQYMNHKKIFTLVRVITRKKY